MQRAKRWGCVGGSVAGGGGVGGGVDICGGGGGGVRVYLCVT